MRRRAVSGAALRCARELQTAAFARPTPRTLHAWGVALLLTGRYDDAIETLQRASGRSAGDSVIGDDRDAALLARGRALNRPQDIVRALDSMDRRSSRPQVLFNRALAMESLYLRRIAREAWTAYLRHDPDPSWSQVARDHLAALAVVSPTPVEADGEPTATAALPPVEDRPELLQAWYEDVGLAAWASAVSRGDDAARTREEQRLAAVAARLERLSGDRLPAEEVASVAAAAPGSRRALADGLVSFGRGKRLLQAYAYENAHGAFLQAARQFRLTGSPRLVWAEASIARCQLQLERYDRARAGAERVLKHARGHGYVAVEARSHWVLAMAGLATLDLRAALRSGLDYLAANERGRSRAGTASANILLGRVYDELGDPASAWVHRLRGFSDLFEDGSSERLALSIGNASFALARQGHHRAAADFASELLAFDREQRTPFGFADSLWTRAMHRAKAGDAREALADLKEAESWLPRVDSAVNRERLLAGIRAVQGEVEAETAPQTALRHLDEALGSLQRSGYEYGQAEILMDRARALRQLGRLNDAAADLDRATDLVMRQRRRVDDATLRVSFFDLQARLADERVALALRLDPSGETAFWAADQARGLLFREHGENGDRQEPGHRPSRRDGQDLVSRLDGDDALLSYWSLPDALLIWVVRSGRAPRLVRQPIPRKQLVQEVAELARAIATRSDVTGQGLFGSRLGRDLVDPVTADLRQVRRLIVVPDRVLRGVPWAALRTAASRGPLVKRFAVSVSPSAVGADRARFAERTGVSPPRLLAVADPEIRSTSPPLARLPAARRELQAIAPLFADRVALMDADATPARVIAELERASVAHFATHFAFDDRGETSRMLLADRSPGHPGVIDSRTVSRLRLPALRLVVLSGCASNREGRPSLEGTFGLAGSFLAAGANDVVATLWPIDDVQASRLMQQFFRRLVAGGPVDEALRSAQVDVIEEQRLSGVQGVDWAAFQVLSLGVAEDENERSEEGVR